MSWESGHTDGDFEDAEAFGAGFGPSVEQDAGGAAGGAGDLDVLPGDAADAGAEGLHRGLLGSEAGGQLGGAAAAVFQLAGGVDAVQEAVSVTLQRPGYAVYLYDVNASGQHGGVRPHPNPLPLGEGT